LKFYEEKFGPFPWYADGFKLVESPYTGMEHQSAIAYGNGYKNTYYGSIDYIILHETAHEWWGNSVTASDLAHAWLHEGFATYAEALYVEKLKGRDAYLDYMLFFQRYYIINRRPIVAPNGLRYFNYKDSDIYMKGSWMLHTLRFTINNDSLFFDLIKSFYLRYAQKEITSQAFVDLVNAKTGVDYNWFFKQYLHNRFVPELHYVIQGTTLYYCWQKTALDFILPVRVKGLKNVISILPKANEVQHVEIDPSQFRIQDEYALIKPVELKHVKELSE
jgi:aminopeptidase N